MKPDHRYELDDDLILTTKEGWFQNAAVGRLKVLDRMDEDQLSSLSPVAKQHYDRERKRWHARMPPLITGPLRRLLDELEPNLDANQQEGNRVKHSLVLDAQAGLGKTTAAIQLGIQFHREQIRERGLFTRDGHERIPVCFIQLTARTSQKSLAIMLAEFYGLPNPYRATAQQLQRGVQRAMSACRTELLIIDDVHFIVADGRSVNALSNHLKYLTNELNATFLLVGIGLRSSSLLSGTSPVTEQTTGRWKIFSMPPFQATTNEHRREWVGALGGIENALRLSNLREGTLMNDLADYVFIRTGGRIGSVMELIRVGASIAISTGVETLSEDLLERVTLDIRAELGRDDRARQFERGALSARPQMRIPKLPPVVSA
jgi:hypothetical protein